MTDRIKFVANGINLEYEVSWNGAAVWVYDSEGLIASADKDDSAEALYYGYHNAEEGALTDFGGSSSDLYRKDWAEIAEWLANTHPEL